MAQSEPDPPLLLTPGPLTTAPSTRQAMTRDWGSRDEAFTAITAEVRERLAAIAGARDGSHVAVPLQGSGTFAVEAALCTLVGPADRALVLQNGAYGRRMAQLLRRAGRAVETRVCSELEPVSADALDAALAASPTITHVAVVHCETTTGLWNPLPEVAAVVHRHGRALIVDAMSAFGALPIDVVELGVACALASSNKCLEGPPGVGFAVVDRRALERSEGHAHSVVLDLAAQWARFEKDGQWRFTPPTHVMAGFLAALRAHEVEGGSAGRLARYQQNCDTLVHGLREHGLSVTLPPELQAPIVVTFDRPEDMDFERFYRALEREGFLIYPGKLTDRETFRVGCIGQLYPADIRRFCAAAGRAL